MSNQEVATQAKAFQNIYKYLQQHNFKPVLHIMDNACSQIVKEYIANNQTIIQFVKAQSHKVNTAERPIQTVKNH